MFEKCEKCGNQLPVFGRLGIKIFPDIPVDICIECHRDFENWLMGHPLWSKVQDYDTVRQHFKLRAQAQDCPSLEELKVLQGSFHELQKKIRLDTLQWLRLRK
jgi:hypothetical protein